jgi:hypothetical protein
MGSIKHATGTFIVGLLAIAGLVVLAALIALSLPHDVGLETPPSKPAPSKLSGSGAQPSRSGCFGSGQFTLAARRFGAILGFLSWHLMT